MNISDIILAIQDFFTQDLINHAAFTVITTLIVYYLITRIRPVKHIVIQIPPKDYADNPRLVSHKVKNEAGLTQIEEAVDLLIKNNLEPEETP